MTTFTRIPSPIEGKLPPASSTGLTPGLTGITDSGLSYGFWVQNGMASGTVIQIPFIFQGGNYTLIEPSQSSSMKSGGAEITDITTSNEIIGNTLDNSKGSAISHGMTINEFRYNFYDAPSSSTTAINTTTPNFKLSGTRFSGSNDKGVVVGTYVDAFGNTHGFTYDQNKFSFSTLDFPQANNSGLIDINNNGTILGTFIDQNRISHGFTYANGVFTKIDDPNSSDTSNTSDYFKGTLVSSINDKGQVVGVYTNSLKSEQKAFLFDNGSYTTLDVPNMAIGGHINNNGVINFASIDFSQGTPALTNVVFQAHDISNLTSSAVSDTVYLLYQGAFNRIPDQGGFSYWSTVATTQKLSNIDIAKAFMSSQEYNTKYGSADGLSNSEFVTKLYENILGREPETSGARYWTQQLDSGSSREQVLVGFAISPENIKAYASHMEGGYWVL